MIRRLAVVCLMLLPMHAWAADWGTVARSVRESIVEVKSDVGSCTGFVIDNERDHVAVAAHCAGADEKHIFADSMPVKIRHKDVKHDTLVLYVEGLDRPALKLAKNDPIVGEEVASYGWGYDMNQPLFRVAHISAKDVTVPQYENARYFAIDAAFVGGQSGGPVVNALGEVVMMVQLGSGIVGWGIGAETLDDKIGRWFSKK